MRKIVIGILMMITMTCACLFAGCFQTPSTDKIEGKLWVGDIYISVGNSADIEYDFTDGAKSEDITYPFSGDGLTISNDTVDT